MSEEFDYLVPKDESNLPSLNSFLNEEESFNFEDFSSVFSDEMSAAASVNDDGTLSINSVLLPIPKVNLGELLNLKNASTSHGSVLRHVILKKVSAQLLDASKRMEAGMLTCMAVSKLFAVGMSHGVVLVFEPGAQVLKLVLGKTSDGLKYGAVTALGINVECTRLLCGYARGQITMWDLNNGNCLRLITEAHPAGYAVLHVHFTDDTTVALLNDSSGSVYTLNFKRKLTRTCESECFFSGSRGEVCTITPLHVPAKLKSNPALANSSLLAMASLTKLIVVNLKPSPAPILIEKLFGPSNCLPLLAWSFSVNKNKQINPILSVARHQTIILYKVILDYESIVQESFQHIQTIDTNYTLVGLAWLNSKILITIDTCERIRTIDVSSQEELECLDIGSVTMVFASSHFKSLATGGNVSKALKAASEHACYHSFQVFNGQLILLGTKSIHCMSLRQWRDRLDFFVKRGEHVQALRLAETFYLGKGKAVVGLITRSIEVENEIMDILLAFLDLAMTVNCPKTNDEKVLTPYFRNLVPISIEMCVLIGKLDFLFEDVYDRFSDDELAKNEFLQGLEWCILDDKLTYLSAVVMQDVVEYFEKSNRLEQLEKCLVHLNLSSMDIDYMVKLCWQHSLYDLLIYIYNKGLSDYMTPFEKLIKQLKTLLEHNDAKVNPLGNKILVYLSCCLAGHQYPIGSIDRNLVAAVKEDIFNAVIKKRSEALNYAITYPHIKLLLQFDTREFLNVLFMAFEEREFETTEDKLVIGMPSKRQKMVDVLLEVMLSQHSPTQLGCLFTFIARQMAKYENSIQVSKQLFEQVLDYLTSADSHDEEREQAMLELYAAGGLRQFEEERILALAEAANFYRVCEEIYRKKKQYEKVLSCYWRDESRKSQAFVYIEELLLEESFTDFEKEEISQAIFNSMDRLAKIDATKFSNLVTTFFPEYLSTIADNLAPNPQLQYGFLKAVFQPDLQEPRKKVKTETEIHETFIRLMCEYNPQGVHNYLRSAKNYRLEQVLVMVQEHNLIHAQAYVLERLGDVKSAFKLLFDELSVKIVELETLSQQSEPFADDTTFEIKTEKVSGCLREVMNLCERNCRLMESEDRESLWFPLLESVMAPQRKLMDSHSQHFSVFKELTRDVITNMTTFISLPAVLQKIMQDPAYSAGKFGDLKELILGMLDTYSYERTLLETTNKLLGKDLLGQYDQHKRILSRGFRCQRNACELCNCDIGGEASDEKLLLFMCGHTYHTRCLQGSLGVDEEMSCVKCNKGHMQGSRSQTMRRSLRKNKQSNNNGASSSKAQQKQSEVRLSRQQTEGLDAVFGQQFGRSKLALRNQNEIKSDHSRTRRDTHFALDENFQLKLAPPIPTK